MGHDIYANHEETEVAYLRKGAFDPTNQAIYISLGVLEEAYGGVSGNGRSLSITLEQFQMAQKLIAKACGSVYVPEEKHASVEIFEKLFGLMDDRLDTETRATFNTVREMDFLRKCITYMEAHQLKELEVAFC